MTTAVARQVQRRFLTLEIELSPTNFVETPTAHTITLDYSSPELWVKARTDQGDMAISLKTYRRIRLPPTAQVFAVHLG